MKTNDKMERPEGFGNWSEEKKAAYEYGYAVARDKYEYKLKNELIKRDWMEGDLYHKFPMNMIHDVLGEDEIEETGYKRAAVDYVIRNVMDEYMDENERRVLRLYYYYDESEEEIAVDLNMSADAVALIRKDALGILRGKWDRIQCIPLSHYEDLRQDYDSLHDYIHESEDMLKKAIQDESREWVKDISIDIMGLTVRPYICLKRADVQTIGDLLHVGSVENLKKIRNIGPKSVEEIQSKMSELNLHFSNENGMEAEK